MMEMDESYSTSTYLLVESNNRVKFSRQHVDLIHKNLNNIDTVDTQNKPFSQTRDLIRQY